MLVGEQWRGPQLIAAFLLGAVSALSAVWILSDSPPTLGMAEAHVARDFGRVLLPRAALRVHVAFAADEQVADLEKQPMADLETTLAYKLWNLEESRTLMRKARESAFVQGIKNNNLKPPKFAVLSLNDAVFIYRSIQHFRVMAANPNSPPLLKRWCTTVIDWYGSFLDSYLDMWHVYDVKCIRLEKAALEYISFLSEVTDENWGTPGYAALANFPCFQLWPSLSEWLYNNTNQDNLFMSWMADNKGYGQAESLAQAIESTSDRLDYARAKDIFLTALQYEVDFFNMVDKLSPEVVSRISN